MGSPQPKGAHQWNPTLGRNGPVLVSQTWILARIHTLHTLNPGSLEKPLSGMSLVTGTELKRYPAGGASHWQLKALVQRRCMSTPLVTRQPELIIYHKGPSE